MMENTSEGVAKYLEKINCLVACIRCEDWVLKVDEESVNEIFKSASEIEGTLSKDKTSKLYEVLKVLYPTHDFKNLGGIVLEAFLVHPELSDKMLLCAINEFLAFFSNSRLYDVIMHLIKTKRLREEFIYLINKLKSDDLLTMLEARSLIYFWEKMILENNENFEKCLIDSFENETSLFLECIKMSSKNTGHLLLCVILRHLNIQNDLKMWFILLNNRNIKTTAFLCGEYPEFMEGLLTFFSKYAFESECHVGKSFSWSHNFFPLNKFVDILHFILMNDGLVGITVNEFINNQISNFGDNYSFWLDIKTLL